ncbi:hypothetical protein Tco_0579165 [Tanacetum coccineum]
MSQPANDIFSQHLSDDEASFHEDASKNGIASNKPKQQQQQQLIPTTTTISNIKLPILKKEEYDIWAMEMEHYLEYIDNDVWKDKEREVPAGFADEVIYSLFVKQSEDLDLLHEDLEQIDDLDIKEMDINWQIAMIAIRMKRFYKKTGRRVWIDGNKPVGFDKKKLECFKCHNTRYFARECTSKGTNDRKKRDSFCQDQGKGGGGGRMSRIKNCLQTLDVRKVGLGYGIKSNNEVLSYEEEMNRTVFNCTEEDFVEKPLYNRFSKTDNLKGVPHPLTRDYTPKPQQEIDESLSNVNTVSPEQTRTYHNQTVLGLLRPRALLLRPQQVIIGGTLDQTPIDHPLKNMEDRGIFDSGCSGHMTGNKDHLDDFEECKGGSVTFGGSKGYITGKGRIRVGNLEFDSVSFVKELGHFNIFSISQICDKQHKLLLALLLRPQQVIIGGTLDQTPIVIVDPILFELIIHSRTWRTKVYLTVDDMLQLVPKLITKVDSLEKELKQTKLTIGKAIVKLVKKVKKMEAFLKRRHVVLTDSEDEDAENSSKQGRNLQEEGLDEMVSLEGLEAAETLAKVLTQRTKTYTRKFKTGLRRKLDADEVSTGEGINTGFTDVNTAFEEINSGDESIIPSPKKGQREGKAVLEEKSQSNTNSRTQCKRTKKQIREEPASLAEIDELELSETQKNRMAQVQEATKFYTEEDWDSVRAKLEANRDLSSKVLSIDFSSDDFAKKMKIGQLKKLKPDELKEEFDKCVEKVEKFIPMNSELEASKLKRTCINLHAEVFKKQKITNVPDVTKDESDTEEDVEAYMDERVDEPSSEEFRMGSIPQGSALAKIVKWQILKTGKKGAYQIIREDHTDVVYVNFQVLLNDLTRDDLKELYRLMMLKYGDSRPEEEYERVLWGDLKTMFDPPSTEDAVWNLTHQQKEAHNEDTQRNLKFTSEDQVRGGLLGIIVNRLKSGSYRVKSGRHS